MAMTLQNPYARVPGKDYVWLKGNLHTHTTLSDGTRDPQVVVDLYAKLGHDFMALSDHDVFSNYAKLDSRGMIFLPGNEVTAFGPHILHIGGTKRIDPLEDRQAVIDGINGDAGFAVLNHPNWEADWDHYPFELMQALTGYIGIEVYNGVCLDLEGSHLAIDKWERLLSVGRIVWAFSNDDSHRDNNEGRGWNVVQLPAGNVTPNAIIEAFKAGQFYGTTGVVIDEIEVTGTELRIKAANAQSIEIYGEKGNRLAWVDGPELRFDASKANSFYIRAQLYGPGSSMAWTQPFLIKGGPADQRRLMEEKFGGPNAVRPTLTALRVDAIDALGSDKTEAAWKRAEESGGFYDWRTGDPPPVKTGIKALVSPTQLALRIECEEPEMAKVRARITEDDNGSLWTDESLEIFIDVENKKQRSYQIMINPLGATYVGHPLGWGKGLTKKTRAVKSANGWTVEILFDLVSLAPGMSVTPGRAFGFHVCRNRLTVGRHYMWSWVGSSNHTPSRYGTLQL
jgi:predicted metal-dependent phosphoesterase TrpH